MLIESLATRRIQSRSGIGMARIIARNGNPCERCGSNTLPLSGTRKAKWHLSKKRVREVGDGVIVVAFGIVVSFYDLKFMEMVYP